MGLVLECLLSLVVKSRLEIDPEKYVQMKIAKNNETKKFVFHFNAPVFYYLRRLVPDKKELDGLVCALENTLQPLDFKCTVGSLNQCPLQLLGMVFK